jgi:GNAT superfamily N-acetyltransferase
VAAVASIASAVSVSLARVSDAAEIAALRTAAAENLTTRHGNGHWSHAATEAGVARGIRTSRVFVAWTRGRIAGTLRLATKRPWAIDPAYFVRVDRPLYLLDMAVHPARQRQGIGRLLLDHVSAVARDWPAGAIRLDAYDHAAGAGDFYSKCGYREVGRVVYRGVPLIYFEQLCLE